MTDDEINRITFEQWGPVIDVPPAAHRAFARAIIAAHTAKLLTGVEMPTRFPAGYASIRPFAHYDDVMQYAAATALNARREALEEAKQACMKGEYAIDGGGNAYYRPADATFCIAAIEALKGAE